jgi:HEPN domain-containing protein
MGIECVVTDKMMREIDAKDFEEKYRSAKGYHKRAKQFLEEGQYHTVVFNVATVALENFHIAIPKPSDSRRILSLCDQVEVLLDQTRIKNKNS